MFSFKYVYDILLINYSIVTEKNQGLIDLIEEE